MTTSDIMNIYGGERVCIAGWNAALTSNSFEFLSASSVAFNETTGARVISNDAGGSLLEVASASANDAAAGTHAQRVFVVGAAPDGTLQSEQIETNGTSSVFGTKRFMAIYAAMVDRFGATKANAGLIHIALTDADGCTNTAGALTAPGPAITMAAGTVLQRNPIWVCPPGENYELTKLVIGSRTFFVSVQMYVRPAGQSAWYGVCEFHKGNSGIDIVPPLPLILQPGDVVRFDAASYGGAGAVSLDAIFTPTRMSMWKRGGAYL